MQNDANVETTIVGIQNNVNISDKALQKFCSSIIPEFIKDLGGVLSDQVKSWRFMNQIKLLEKTKKICEENNIPLKAVKLKFLVPLLENSSLEEDKNMQTRWAALLASAIKQTDEINPSFIDILKQLTSKEATVLDKLYVESSQKASLRERNELQFSKEKVMEIFFLTEENFDLMLDNLFRLNLCRTPASHNGTKIGNYPIMLQTKDVFEFTSLGYAFVRACIS